MPRPALLRPRALRVWLALLLGWSTPRDGRAGTARGRAGRGRRRARSQPGRAREPGHVGRAVRLRDAGHDPRRPSVVERPSPRGPRSSGAALGLAFVAKVSAVLLLPGLAVLPLLAPARGGSTGRRTADGPRPGGVIVAWAVVCGAYLLPRDRPSPGRARCCDPHRSAPGRRRPRPAPAAARRFLTAFDASWPPSAATGTSWCSGGGTRAACGTTSPSCGC